MRRVLWLQFVGIAGLLSGCGADSNFNQIWGGRDTQEGKLQQAKLYYDSGNYAEAAKIAQDLLNINSDNEDAAILLGYTHLSIGGIDPFRLSCKMITINSGQECPRHPASTTSTQNSTQTTTTTTPTSRPSRLEDHSHLARDAAAFDLLTQSNTRNNGSTPTSNTSTSSSNKATDVLKKLSQELLSISDTEYSSLSVGKYSTGIFASAPIYQPQRISEPLRESVNILREMNLALKSVCRFVDTSVLAEFQNTEKTGRYDTNCTQTTQARRNTAKAHFLWAFAHLTEAMVYQSVLLYSSASTVTNGSSNFEAAVNSISNKTYLDSTGISSFASDVDELKNLTDAVFDTTDGSMLSETIKDLRSSGLAINALSLPSEISGTITKALDNLETISQKITQTTDVSSRNSKALKTQITENFAKTIGTKLNSVFDKQIDDTLKKNDSLTDEQKAAFKDKFTASGVDDLTDEEKTAIFGNKAADVETSLVESCTAYEKISADLPPESAAANKPAVCK